MRNQKGQFSKGYTWREEKPYWNKRWLQHRYTIMCKPASQIAKEQGCKENNILYFLNKHGIARRTMSHIRKHKYWGSGGEQNGMFGRSGNLNPNWRGGITPERQSLYCSQEWASVIKLVWKRDRWECRKCHTEKTSNTAFHIHHMIPFEAVELRCDLGNLVLLCKGCHNWIHSKENKLGEYVGTLLDSR